MTKTTKILIGIGAIAVLGLLTIQTIQINESLSQKIEPVQMPLGSVASRNIRVTKTGPTFFGVGDASSSPITLTDMADTRFVTLDIGVQASTSASFVMIRPQVANLPCTTWYNAGDSWYYHVSTAGGNIGNLVTFTGTSTATIINISPSVGATGSVNTASTSITNVTPIGASCLRFLTSVNNGPADIYFEAVNQVETYR